MSSGYSTSHRFDPSSMLLVFPFHNHVLFLCYTLLILITSVHLNLVGSPWGYNWRHNCAFSRIHSSNNSVCGVSISPFVIRDWRWTGIVLHKHWSRTSNWCEIMLEWLPCPEDRISQPFQYPLVLILFLLSFPQIFFRIRGDAINALFRPECLLIIYPQHLEQSRIFTFTIVH